MIYQKYQFYADRVVSMSKVKHPRVLLTDVYNELNTESPIIPHICDKCEVTAIDINPYYVERTKEKFPQFKFLKGDIRDLQFKDEDFDIIIDNSTIDHVPEWPKVLREYKRVLKNDGLLLLTVWLDNRFIHQPSEKDAGQYVFPRREFVDEMENRFKIIEIELLSGILGGLTADSVLTRFIVRRK